MWSYEVCGPRTGRRYHDVVLASTSWDVRMNGQVGSGTSVIETRDPVYAAWSGSFFRQNTLPWERVLVGKWNEEPVWAHIITDRSFDFKTGRLTLQHSEIGTLLRSRFFHHSSSYSASASMTLGPYTRASLVKAMVLEMCGGGWSVPEADWSSRRMPVHVGELAAGTVRLTTKQSEFEKPWDRMVEISESASPIDFTFEPGFGADPSGGGPSPYAGFEWRFRFGSPMTRSEHSYTVNAPKSPILDLQVHDNAGEFATAVFALGEGMGDDRPVRRAGSARVPERPSVVNYGKISDPDRLLSQAQGELAYVQDFPDSWTMKMDAATVCAPMLGGNSDGIRPGSRINLEWNDRYWGIGSKELYVTSIKGDDSDVVSVEVQALWEG